MKVKAIQTRIFKEHEHLGSFIISSVKTIQDGSVLVVASKLVALSEGRTVFPYTKALFEKLVKEESDFALQTMKTWLTERQGMIVPSAGIDESNGKGKLVLLPRDPYHSAVVLQRALLKHYKIKKLGIIISDSGLIPLRRGVIGLAIGFAGFEGIRDYKGKKDLFGRKLVMSATNIADSLATAGGLHMGEGDECCPLALITDAPATFISSNQKEKIKIPRKEDMFYPLLKNLR